MTKVECHFECSEKSIAVVQTLRSAESGTLKEHRTTLRLPALLLNNDVPRNVNMIIEMRIFSDYV